jgi:hypothetical protein
VALSHALEQLVPGFSYFARIQAYGLDSVPKSARVARAVLFILEPESTGRSAGTVFQEILHDDHSRCELFKRVLQTLEAIRDADDPKRLVRALGRPASDPPRVEDLGNNSISLGCVDRLTRRDQGESWSLPKPEFDASLTPAPYQPDWDLDGDTTTWESCLEFFWISLKSRFRGFQQQDLVNWPYVICFVVRHTEGSFQDWANCKDLAESLPHLALNFRGSSIQITPGSDTTGASFRAALEKLLVAGVGQEAIPPGMTISLHAWVVPRDEFSHDSQPGRHAPFNSYLAGGFNSLGLGLETVPTKVAPIPEGDDSFLLPSLPVPTNTVDTRDRWGAVIPVQSPMLNAQRGHSLTWVWRNRDYELKWGFENPVDLRTYTSVFKKFSHRISNESWGCYAWNDPYLDSIHELADHLLEIYGGQVDTSLPEFLLAFVQSFPYVADPTDVPTDWPLFPTEYLALRGGDCEDSSILYLALLTRFGFDAVFINQPGHLAVGVAGPYSGSYYEEAGTHFYLAETATDRSYCPIGMGSAGDESASLIHFPGGHLPRQGPVQVLAFHTEATVHRCTLLSQLPPGSKLVVSLSLRFSSDLVEAKPDSIELGATRLPAQEKPSQLISFDLPWDETQVTGIGSAFVDITVWSEDEVVAYWPGAQKVEYKRGV